VRFLSTLLEMRFLYPLLWTTALSATPLNVHVAPHSHQDTGWGETYLQYYYGTGPYGPQFRNATKVFSQVVKGLLEDPARRFSFVEQAFFQLFYESASAPMQADVRSLVTARRLVFLNGGFSMSDEAAPTYLDMLDNYATGHRSIAAEFGAGNLPRTAWQIDPFGHSATQGILSSPAAGFQGVLWGREPLDFKAACRPGRALERIWLPSRSLGASAATFGATFYDPGYDFPPWNRCTLTANASACARDQGFADAALAAAEIADSRAPQIRGNDVLLNMGTDWSYHNAVLDPAYPSQGALFAYIDGVIAGLNADPKRRFNAFYSTAADYVAAKMAANLTFPALVTDLFPYNNDAAGHQNWVGYYTSRPAFKGYVRETSSVLQTARQLQALTGGIAGVGPTNSLFALERAMGVAQHHDAISGTAVQEVNDDYAARLAAGRALAFAGMAGAFAAATGYTAEVFAPCELANATLCEPLEAGQPTVALVYNSQGQAAPAAPVRLPAGFPAGIVSWAVYDADGAPVTAQLVPPSPRDAALRALYNGTAAPVQWLCFTGQLPPAGYAAFFLLPCNATGCAPFTHASAVTAPPGSAGAAVSNGRLTLTLSGATGFLSHYQDAATGVALPLTQSWAAYEGFNGASALNGSRAASGAYLFRPARSDPDALAPGLAAAVTLVTGPCVNLTYQEYGYVTQEMRLWAGAGDVEIEWTVGPVDLAGNKSREVITRYSAGGLASGGAWRTDSNCRESQLRQRNARGNWTANVSEPVAGNYYPATCLLSLTDGAQATLSVALDRAQGVSSLADGTLELLVHRRMAHRDGYEPRGYLLNEPGVDGKGLIIRGRHWLLAAPAHGAAAAAAAKTMAQRALAAPATVTAFAGLDLAPQLWLASYRGRASLLSAPLPPNLHLATVHVHNESSWLVRLAHLYEAGEGGDLSGSASVDLATLFAPRAIAAAVEVTLPGAMPLASVQQTTYRTEGGLVVTLPRLPPAPVGVNLTVTLEAMQIRAFMCTMA
jgi:lysosomal alpha-mannosidase